MSTAPTSSRQIENAIGAGQKRQIAEERRAKAKARAAARRGKNAIRKSSSVRSGHRAAGRAAAGRAGFGCRIQIQKNGSDPAGAAGYANSAGKDAQVVFGFDSRNWVSSTNALKLQRPDIKKYVGHLSLSLPSDTNFNLQKLGEMAEKVLDELGIDPAIFPVSVVRHHDEPHPHCHIFYSRIGIDGTVFNSDNLGYRCSSVAQSLEQIYQLNLHPRADKSARKASPKPEIEKALRTNTPSTRMVLQTLCENAQHNTKTFSEYVQKLAAARVSVIPTIQQNGAVLTGLLYEFDGVRMKGSDLGRGFTPKGLSLKGINYSQSADGELVATLIAAEKARKLSQPQEQIMEKQIMETLPKENEHEHEQQAGNRAGIGSEPTAATNSTAGTSTAAASPEQVDHGIVGSVVGQPQNGARAEPTTDRNASANAGIDESDALDHADSAESIYQSVDEFASDLSATLGSAGDGADKGRTALSVAEQLEVMGCQNYDIKIFNQVTGKEITHSLKTPETLAKSINFLRRTNAQGSDIYIRPSENSGLILVDHLDARRVEKMRQDGLEPALVLETSPGMYQAWARFTKSDRTLSEQVRKALSDELAKRYSLAVAPADHNPFGRLSGTTNQDPGRAKDGRAPYVTTTRQAVRNDPVGQAAMALLSSIYSKLRDLKTVADAKAEAAELLKQVMKSDVAIEYSSPLHRYRSELKKLLANGTSPGEEHDIAVATKMLSANFKPTDLAEVLEEDSPVLESRGNPDYVQRVLKAATEAAQEDKKKQELLKQAQRKEQQQEDQQYQAPRG